MQDQNKTVQLAEMKIPATREQNLPVVTMGFGSLQSFELMQRAAKMLAYSTLVPTAYRAVKEIKDYGKVTGYEDNPAALPNCVVALNMAQRMGADPLMVMQNLYIVEGRPSWSSQFIIAAINSCGRYSPLRFELSAIGEPKPVKYMETKWVNKQKTEVEKTITVAARTCVAWAIELASGDRLESPVVSMDMAVAEGWIQKNGSKWQTMPEVMLRYRAAAFFGKLYAPELLMGLQTAEEAHDIIDVERQENGQYAAATTLNELRSTGAPDADRKAADDELEPVEVKDVAPVAAEPAAEQPADNVKPAKKPLTQEDADLYEKVAGMLNRAGTLSQLADAADQVGEVENKELRAQLTVIYKQRLAEFNAPVQAEPATAAPTKRSRRTGAAGTVE